MFKGKILPVRDEGEMGSMLFDRTLRDWKNLNVFQRTDFDASYRWLCYHGRK
jgi:hypothetical protein